MNGSIRSITPLHYKDRSGGKTLIFPQEPKAELDILKDRSHWKLHSSKHQFQLLVPKIL
jgi:hypothetical protein